MILSPPHPLAFGNPVPNRKEVLTTKAFVPQGGTRVRSFVHSPNLLPAGSAGTNYTGIISASDIFPTFCAIAGVPLPSQASAPNQLDGMSTSTCDLRV